MSDLFDKLNTLLRSSVDSLLHSVPGIGSDEAATTSLDPAALRDPRAIADVERKVDAMRKQIDAALREEDAMQARLDEVQRQQAAYDQQADAALERGDESEARRLVGLMQQARHRASMLAAQLDEHRTATSAYIERVNMLEAMIVDARQMHEATAASDSTEATNAPPSQQAEARPDLIPPALAGQLDQLGKATGAKLNDLLQTVRERAETVLAPIIPRSDEAAAPVSSPLEQASTAQPAATDTATTAKTAEGKDIDDDLARRRERLSKPE
ncbi:MAG: hypothetical protein KF726_04670 [Anaerolineae bacterium]|nr:hypothetical protein [Anaerolineae bacterium]